MKASSIQKLLAHNRQYITGLHEYINYQRMFKTEADEGGDLEQEYYYHNELKASRKELAKLVVIQKELKTLLKEVK